MPRIPLVRRACTVALGLTLALVVAADRPAAQTAAGAAWKPATGRLMTRFAAAVSPSSAWPEYPRPQLVRPDWQNLNGLWDYAVRAGSEVEAPSVFDGRILVPFPIESALSGVGRLVSPDQRLWYRTTFRIPSGWKGRRVWLRFGAVDWEATVWVNGRQIGAHTGGYDPFGFDITDALRASGDQALVVRVFDPTDQGEQPRGKQVMNPRSIWYTPTTGIWQTAWLEPLPAVAIDRLTMTPDADAGTLRVEAALTAPSSRHTIRVTARAGSQAVAKCRGAGGRAGDRDDPEPSPLVAGPAVPLRPRRDAR